MEPFSIWLLTNAALLDRWQKVSNATEPYSMLFDVAQQRINPYLISLKKKPTQLYLKKLG